VPSSSCYVLLATCSATQSGCSKPVFPTGEEQKMGKGEQCVKAIQGLSNLNVCVCVCVCVCAVSSCCSFLSVGF